MRRCMAWSFRGSPATATGLTLRSFRFSSATISPPFFGRKKFVLNEERKEGRKEGRKGERERRKDSFDTVLVRLLLLLLLLLFLLLPVTCHSARTRQRTVTVGVCHLLYLPNLRRVATWPVPTIQTRTGCVNKLTCWQ